MGQSTLIHVLLVDDYEIVREGLRALFAKQSDTQVVGEAADGRAAVQLARELTPDVIIMDDDMPELNGAEATRHITKSMTDIRILALSAHSQGHFVTEMLKAGACGYLHKSCSFDELVRAIHTVVANKIYLSPQITTVVVDEYVHHLSAAPASCSSKLTDREREVLQLLVEGKAPKTIALQLNLGVKTIEGYRRQIMDKLGIYSIAELTKYAVLEGVTPLEI